MQTYPKCDKGNHSINHLYNACALLSIWGGGGGGGGAKDLNFRMPLHPFFSYLLFNKIQCHCIDLQIRGYDDCCLSLSPL